MTNQEPRSAPRSIAAIMAVVLMTAIWLPTVSTPAQATAPAGQGVVVVASSGAYTPALM
ncbi:hypothetical protein [Novosphingobium mangrovi (ex Huang et al. 2023)]|uniref:Uncharacterized protein n=1 Tax=Novosphingobium mangrovi (ex Huang et al. 2023) TaxID=2976432 RepID=A0ABT2I2M5_9SPHN|nr:hypothetical protein [Novosphingobium mangrovi (ex Huang et al. 2023)]MCT2399046.1 hypothetical protein [Novosphingobium mangrovi (ex Huang et al. 2023)]